MGELLALPLGSIARFNSLYVCRSLFARRLLHRAVVRRGRARGNFLLPLREIRRPAHLNELEHKGEHHGEVHHELLHVHVKHLDARVDAERIEHEQNADDRDEAEREDLHLRMLVDEVGNRVDEHHHHNDRDHNREDHDDEVVRQAHRRDNRVD